MNSHYSGSLDTNILARLLLPDNESLHQQAKDLFGRYQSFVVADVAITELVFVLSKHYGFSRTQVGEAIEGLIKLKQVICSQPIFTAAITLYVKHPALSFEDCYLASYAKQNQTEPLWTFDKKLAKQASSAQLVT